MVMREIYSTGLKERVMCEVREIVATPSKGSTTRYQVVGYYTHPETGREHRCQSMIGAQEAATICEQLGIQLPSVSEPEPDAAFAAEASEPATTEGELLVPEPSTDPVGDGRIIGQHTGGEIVSATDAAPSLPAHDYVWAGRAEDKNYAIYGRGEGSSRTHAPYAKSGSALSRLKKAIAGDSPQEVAIPMEAGLQDQAALEQELSEAEFEEVADSINNVYEDIEGREVFVVDTPIRNYLSDEFAEEVRAGLIEISSGDSADEYEIAFPYVFSEAIIDAIAEFQESGDEYGYYSRDDYGEDYPEEEEDIYAARGFADAANEMPAGLSRSTVAVITAALGLGAAWWWSTYRK